MCPVFWSHLKVLSSKLLRADDTVNWYRIYWRRMCRQLQGKELESYNHWMTQMKIKMGVPLGQLTKKQAG